MSSSIYKWLAILITQLSVLQAHANLNVTCISDDCLRFGWEAYDERTGDSAIALCREGDCSKSGWHDRYKGNLMNEVFCKPDGCFIEGWTVYSGRSGRTVADISCQTSFAFSDCLQFGWTTFEPGRGSYVTRCVNGDCRNLGWDVFIPGYPTQSVRCKTGGCFNSGWTVFR